MATRNERTSKELTSARDAQTLLAAARSGCPLNGYNAAHALHRLHAIVVTEAGGRAGDASERACDELLALIQRQQLVGRMGAKHVSKMYWSLSKLSRHLDLSSSPTVQAVLCALRARIRVIGHELDAQACSNLAYAMALADPAVDDAPLAGVLAEAVARRASELNALDVATFFKSRARPLRWLCARAEGRDKDGAAADAASACRLAARVLGAPEASSRLVGQLSADGVGDFAWALGWLAPVWAEPAAASIGSGREATTPAADASRVADSAAAVQLAQAAARVAARAVELAASLDWQAAAHVDFMARSASHHGVDISSGSPRPSGTDGADVSAGGGSGGSSARAAAAGDALRTVHARARAALSAVREAPDGAPARRRAASALFAAEAAALLVDLGQPGLGAHSRAKRKRTPLPAALPPGGGGGGGCGASSETAGARPSVLVFDDARALRLLKNEHACATRRWRRFARGKTRGRAWSPRARTAAGTFDACAMRMPALADSLTLALHGAAAQMREGAALWLYAPVADGVLGHGMRALQEGVPPAPRAHAPASAGAAAGRPAEAARVLLFERARVVRADAGCALLCARRTREPAHARTAAWRTTEPTPAGAAGAAALLGAPARWSVLPGLFSGGGLDVMSALLLRALPAPRARARVLDFGCGSGALARALLARTASVELTLLDADALAIAAARRNVRAHTCLVSDGFCALPARAAGSFDWIVSNPPVHACNGVEQDFGVLERLCTQAPAWLRRARGSGPHARGGELHLVAQEYVPVGALLDGTRAYTHVRAVYSSDGRFAVWSARVRDGDPSSPR